MKELKNKAKVTSFLRQRKILSKTIELFNDIEIRTQITVKTVKTIYIREPVKNVLAEFVR